MSNIGKDNLEFFGFRKIILNGCKAQLCGYSDDKMVAEYQEYNSNSLSCEEILDNPYVDNVRIYSDYPEYSDFGYGLVVDASIEGIECKNNPEDYFGKVFNYRGDRVIIRDAVRRYNYFVCAYMDSPLGLHKPEYYVENEEDSNGYTYVSFEYVYNVVDSTAKSGIFIKKSISRYCLNLEKDYYKDIYRADDKNIVSLLEMGKKFGAEEGIDIFESLADALKALNIEDIEFSESNIDEFEGQ